MRRETAVFVKAVIMVLSSVLTVEGANTVFTQQNTAATAAAFSFSQHQRRRRMTKLNMGVGKKKKPSSNTGGGKGFGNSSGSNILDSLDMTYGESQRKIKDLIIDDMEAMNNFFTTNMEWHPLFRSVLLTKDEEQSSSRPPACSCLTTSPSMNEEESCLIYTESTPWKRLDAIPTLDAHKAIVGEWLDSFQLSLLNIPVDESNTQGDPLDTHFIMEGKRMLATSRFHVIDEQRDEPLVSRRDLLFQTCWSEMAELRQANVEDTGSVILIPGYEIDLVKRFMDMNLLKPLMWLGLDDIFEVSSFKRGNIPAIRLLHKLSDMPTDEELRENRQASTLN